MQGEVFWSQTKHSTVLVRRFVQHIGGFYLIVKLIYCWGFMLKKRKKQDKIMRHAIQGSVLEFYTIEMLLPWPEIESTSSSSTMELVALPHQIPNY